MWQIYSVCGALPNFFLACSTALSQSSFHISKRRLQLSGFGAELRRLVPFQCDSSVWRESINFNLIILRSCFSQTQKNFRRRINAASVVILISIFTAAMLFCCQVAFKHTAGLKQTRFQIIISLNCSSFFF